ncbi:MAG TPA: hypothetical protein VFT99_21055, partial [Roseiflexaceae bacterium]|nr:hypothetical protein [Roseiflexaceae bacterium]
MKRSTLVFLMVCCLLASTLGLRHVATLHAETAPGTIAYARASTGDEIRLIEPDGTHDRRLWAHTVADPNQVYNVYSTTWRPDASELTFASTHENWCSINYSDVFSIAPDGSRYRRLTQAPGCSDLAQYPKGTVRVPVKNVSVFGNSFAGFVYIQGAPSVLPVALAPGASTVVVFENVADLGPDKLQVSAAINGANREYDIGTAVDVESGGTVTAGTLVVAIPENKGWEPRSPTWRADGAKLGYVYGYNALFGIPANPSPLEFGSRILDPTNGPNIVEHMAFAPAGARANQVLFGGYDGDYGIYLGSEGSTGSVERLVTTGFYAVRGLAWLPDSSGFVYSVEEEENYEITRA